MAQSSSVNKNTQLQIVKKTTSTIEEDTPLQIVSFEPLKKEIKAPPPTQTPKQRGFWSATQEMISGIPGAALSAGEMALHGVIGDYPWINQRIAELGSSIDRRAAQLQQQGYGMGGYPAAIVRTAGEQIGIPSEAIAEDWRQRNFPALAGDVAAPFIVAGAAKGAEKLAAPQIKKFQTAQLARAGEKQISALELATQSYVPKNVEPTLWREKLTSVVPLMEEAANSKTPTTTPAGKTDHWSPAIDGVQGARNKVDWGIRNREQQIEQQLQPYADVKLPVNLFQRVMDAFGSSDLPTDVRAKAQQAATDVLRREGIRSGTEITIKNGNALLHKLNAAIRNVMADTKAAISDVRQNNATFASNEIMAKALRDALYDTAENLGVKNVRETRQLIGNAMDVRNVFQDMIHKGKVGVGQPSMPRQLIATGVGASIGAMPGLVIRDPIVAQIGATGGGLVGNQIAKPPTVNVLIDQAFSRPTQRPSAPKPFAEPRRLNPPAPDMGGTTSTEKWSPWKNVTAETLIDMIDPEGKPKRLPANQVHDAIQEGWTGPQTPSEFDVAELGRSKVKASAPNIAPVTVGYGPAQARELGDQTRVPGGAFDPSAITFGGRTAEQVLPFTAKEAIRLGATRGGYQVMKLTYPDMPDVSNNGRFEVTLPSGDVVRFSTKNAQQNAQRFVDQFIREFGR